MNRLIRHVNRIAFETERIVKRMVRALDLPHWEQWGDIRVFVAGGRIERAELSIGAGWVRYWCAVPA